jgi:hypothetical protein
MNNTDDELTSGLILRYRLKNLVNKGQYIGRLV